MSTNWKLDGTYFETCNCDVACPCVFASPPTEGDCTVIVAWHIDRGSYGDVSLGGLNVAMAAYIPGHMLETPWQVALYLDENANAEQQEALTMIYGGQAGGIPAALGEFIDEVLGVKSTAIKYQARGRQRSLKINGVADVAIAGIDGQGGADVTISNHPIAVAPGYPTAVAKSKKMSYQDHGFNWELSGKTAYYSPFTYEGP
jgi:hypothetical protein